MWLFLYVNFSLVLPLNLLSYKDLHISKASIDRARSKFISGTAVLNNSFVPIHCSISCKKLWHHFWSLTTYSITYCIFSLHYVYSTTLVGLWSYLPVCGPATFTYVHDLNTCSASDSTGSGLLRSCEPPHSEDNLLDNSTEVCQQHKEPDYCFDGSVKLSLAHKSGGRESWHLDRLRISECPSYLFSSLSIQLWHRPSQSSCARKWDCVHSEPKVKSSLRKPDIEAYGVSGSHYTSFSELFNRWMWIPDQT